MNSINFPKLSEYDPPNSQEGAIDPLGLYSIADNLALRLIPGIRERMKHPRFLTAMAVGNVFTRKYDEDLIAADGQSEPYLVYEWHMVEGIVRTRGNDETLSGHIQPGSAVRLANGKTETETRQNLMLTFNTPFFPEILVASMIMAEGVDLHLNCRHIIHHDLCWNPSTLEQRTGRIDRIGAKVERCGLPINIYLPYIAQTQDEKMYRVVMDRERWFKVVMGENYKVDARTTEKLAERVPFPESAARGLIFNLSVFSDN